LFRKKLLAHSLEFISQGTSQNRSECAGNAARKPWHVKVNQLLNVTPGKLWHTLPFPQFGHWYRLSDLVSDMRRRKSLGGKRTTFPNGHFTTTVPFAIESRAQII
jgi:hypothetical protein